MNKTMRKTLTVLLFIMIFSCSVIAVQAHEAVDLERKDCSLTIEVNYGGKPLSGGTLTLYRVGDVMEDNGNFGFAWRTELNCMLKMDNLQSPETAQKVLECVKQYNISGVTADNNGKVVFEELEVGLYLIEQQTEADGYSKITPFLISLPQWEDDHYVYSLTAVAKGEIKKESGVLPYSGRIPYTGQLKWPVPVLFVIGAILITVGFMLRRKSEDA